VSEQRRGYQTSISGLVGALLVIFVLIVAIWGLARLQNRDVADPAPTVDYSDQLEAARRDAPFDVLAPDPVPDGWRATSADWTVAGPVVSWHLGFLTGGDDADYVGLEQGNQRPEDFVEAKPPADRPGPPVEIDGAEWQQLTGQGETALVLFGDGVTTIVTGTASLDELTDFAASLTAD